MAVIHAVVTVCDPAVVSWSIDRLGAVFRASMPTSERSKPTINADRYRKPHVEIQVSGSAQNCQGQSYVAIRHGILCLSRPPLSAAHARLPVLARHTKATILRCCSNMLECGGTLADVMYCLETFS